MIFAHVTDYYLEKQRPFVTGSADFGRITDDSDVDIVLRVDDFDLKVLQNLGEYSNDYEPKVQYSIRFGKLNLICCTTDEVYEAWVEATRRALEIVTSENRRLSKEESKELFRKVFEERCLT